MHYLSLKSKIVKNEYQKLMFSKDNVVMKFPAMPIQIIQGSLKIRGGGGGGGVVGSMVS